MPDLADDGFYQVHAELCGVFANANRLKLLEVLSDGAEYTVSELEAASGISQPTISHHLKLMRSQAIVTRRSAGAKNYYAITDDRLIEAMEIIAAVLEDRRTAETGTGPR